MAIVNTDLRDQRKFAEAGPQFYAAAQLNPGSPEPWNELASVLIVSEQYPQALAASYPMKLRTGLFALRHAPAPSIRKSQSAREPRHSPRFA